MLLFVLSTVPLIEMIKDNNKIKGLTTKRNNTIKIQSYADDNTILINTPHEFKAIIETYNRHSKASEAKINQEKTKIFRLGNHKGDEPQHFRDKIADKVTILGATYCRNIEDETQENLIKPTEKLKQLEGKCTLSPPSIVGKILQIHTYIYSKIWHIAWLIDVNSAPFETFTAAIGKYLQRFKHKQVLESVAKNKTEGGLGLINLKERITTLKVQATIEAGTQSPESDNILYEVGFKQETIFGKSFSGPKKEIPEQETYNIVKLIEKSKKEIQQYKGKKKQIKIKDIQTILFPKDNGQMCKQIFQSKNPKLISINYLTKYDLLPLFTNTICHFCRKKKESTDHILLKCKHLEQTRQKTQEWLGREGCNDFTREQIIEMEEIKAGTQNIIVSVYKETIWRYRNRAIYKPAARVETITSNMEKEILHYLYTLDNE